MRSVFLLFWGTFYNCVIVKLMYIQYLRLFACFFLICTVLSSSGRHICYISPAKEMVNYTKRPWFVDDQIVLQWLGSLFPMFVPSCDHFTAASMMYTSFSFLLSRQGAVVQSVVVVCIRLGTERSFFGCFSLNKISIFPIYLPKGSSSSLFSINLYTPYLIQVRKCNAPWDLVSLCYSQSQSNAGKC